MPSTVNRRRTISPLSSTSATWLNGELNVDYQDDVTVPPGFIALQMHGTRDQGLVGKTVEWRGLRLKPLN